MFNTCMLRMILNIPIPLTIPTHFKSSGGIFFLNSESVLATAADMKK